METSALAWIAVAAMIASLLLIPLGLPGIWVMIAILLLGVFGGLVSPWIFLLIVGLGGFAEFLEFVAVGRMTSRYGGTNRTFWGALVGGLIGALGGGLGVGVAGVLSTRFVLNMPPVQALRGL